MCHPDKTKDDPHKTQLYKEAESAWRNGSYDILYRIAIELNIEPPEQTEESVAILAGMSSDLEKQIHQKEQSVLWMWGTASETDRERILDLYLKIRRKKRK
jgi:transcriptional regulator with XRE-family HTH domain